MKEPASTVLEADPRWYEKLDPHWHDEAWRDPYVLPAPGGGWAMLVTARAADGDPAERGVVGRCTSDDLDTGDDTSCTYSATNDCFTNTKCTCCSCKNDTTNCDTYTSTNACCYFIKFTLGKSSCTTYCAPRL